MPRLSEVSKNGHDDLRQAIARFIGDQSQVSQVAGLIPYQEWKYFEDQLLLFVKLQTFIAEESNLTKTIISSKVPVIQEKRSKKVFPRLADIESSGDDVLCRLIRQYGGQKFIASRLSMSLASTSRRSMKNELQWGSFDLDFAVDLLEFVRDKHMRLQPPMEIPLIKIPDQNELMSEGKRGIRLALQIKEFGGYENVARRLGLAYFEVEKRPTY